MSRRPWYKRYGGDFVLGTMALTLEEKGAYSICLDLIYDRGGPIPDDGRWLAGVCGVSVRKWGAIRDRLIEAGKLEVRDGCLANRRADREIAEAADQSAIRAENGAKGGRKRAENVAKPEDNFGENDTATRENNNLAQARLKPNQKPEPEPEKEAPPSPPGGDGALDLRPFAKLLLIIATAGMTFDQAVQAAWEAQPIVDGKRRSTRPDVQRAFGGVLRRGSMPGEALAGLRAYYALPASTKDGGRFAHGAAVILNRDRWREFVDGPAQAASVAVAPTFDGPPELRRAVVEAKDEDFALRWLTGCSWNPEGRQLVARNRFTAETLRRELGPQLERWRVEVVERERAVA